MVSRFRSRRRRKRVQNIATGLDAVRDDALDLSDLFDTSASEGGDVAVLDREAPLDPGVDGTSSPNVNHAAPDMTLVANAPVAAGEEALFDNHEPDADQVEWSEEAVSGPSHRHVADEVHEQLLEMLDADRSAAETASSADKVVVTAPEPPAVTTETTSPPGPNAEAFDVADTADNCAEAAPPMSAEPGESTANITSAEIVNLNYQFVGAENFVPQEAVQSAPAIEFEPPIEEAPVLEMVQPAPTSHGAPPPEAGHPDAETAHPDSEPAQEPASAAAVGPTIEAPDENGAVPIAPPQTVEDAARPVAEPAPQPAAIGLANPDFLARRSIVIAVENVHLTYPVGGHRRGSVKSSLLGLFGHKEKGGQIQKVNAIRGVSFTAQFGERIGIIGRNGSGKSTLLRVLAGVYPLDKGDVCVKGEIGTLLDISLGFEPESTGRENIYNRGFAMGRTRKELQAAEAEIVDLAGLGEFIDLPMRTYSAGMYVRLGFAISTQFVPDVLLVDEVFSAGDAAFVQRARKRMEQLTSRAGVLVMVSHEFSTILDNCNRVIWMDSGKIMYDGTPHAAIDHYVEAVTAGTLGQEGRD